MKRFGRIFMSAFVASGVLLAAGCNGETIVDSSSKVVTNDVQVVQQEQNNTEQNQTTQNEPQQNTEQQPQKVEVTPEVKTESFALVKDVMFEFSTGAGGWSTELFINEDGTFSVNYHDSEMGITGEDYPNGTIYTSLATGKFIDLVKISEDTYSFTLSELTLSKEPGIEEIADGLKFITTTPYGLEEGKKFMLYTKGKDVSQLSEDFRFWLVCYLPENNVLDNFVIHNIEKDYAFKGYSFSQ